MDGQSKEQVFERAQNIIRDKACREDTLYVFSLYHSGDTMKLAAYAHHLKEFYSQPRIAFVSLQKNSVVKDMFDAVDEIITISEEEREILELTSQQHVCMYGENWIVGSSKNMLLSHFPGPEGVYGTDVSKVFPNACEAYKSMILQIPYFYDAADVSSDFVDAYDEILAERYKNSILLAPFAYSIPSPEPYFWEDLARWLKEEGYDVYTNVSQSEQEIDGTMRLCEDLRTTFNLCRYFSAIISTRSGFSDFMAFQPEVLHIVFSPEENMMRFHDIAAYGRSEKIYNINWNMRDPMPEQEMLERVEDILEEYA